MHKIVTKKGTFFREKVYIDGVAIHSPRFTRKSDASNWKARFKSDKMTYQSTGQKTESLLKIEEQNEKKLEVKFFDYATLWLKTRVKLQLSYRTYEQYSSNLKLHIFPMFGHITLEEITRVHGDLLIEKLASKGHNAKGINVILGVFKRVMLEAFREGNIEKNPFQNLKDLKEQKRPDIFLTNHEIERILAVSNDHYFHTLFLLAVNTGLRRGELAGLNWSHVNFDNNLIEINSLRDRLGLSFRTKTSSSKRFIPMNFSVRQHLLDLKKLKSPVDDELIILTEKNKPFNVDHLFETVRRYLKLAKISKEYRFHDIRHTFASHFMMNGGNIYDLQKILGHSSLEMTQRYAHLAPEHLVKASNVVSFGAKLEERKLKKI